MLKEQVPNITVKRKKIGSQASASHDEVMYRKVTLPGKYFHGERVGFTDTKSLEFYDQSILKGFFDFFGIPVPTTQYMIDLNKFSSELISPLTISKVEEMSESSSFDTVTDKNESTSPTMLTPLPLVKSIF